MSETTTASAQTAVRPFQIEVPEREIEELRRRIDATRWPTKELVADRSQGVQLAVTQELARYWTTEYDWGPIRIGRAWHELMLRLGYRRYVAQGGDVGSQVTDAMGRLSLDGLQGIHTNLLTPALGDVQALSASPPTREERAALDQLDAFHATGTGYFVEQATRPQTIGYALLDSPIALAAWMIDHDTDAYQKIARAFIDKTTSGNLTRDHVLDNITLYWLTGTGASAARSYWEEGQEGVRG